jgi:peptide/nickel transport system ATP-binding protein
MSAADDPPLAPVDGRHLACHVTRSPVRGTDSSRGDGPALELRDVEVVYERRGRESVRAVAGASLTVERGQIVGLVGESGCGKSSLARASVGLVRPSAGTVLFEGRDVTPLTRRARSRGLVGLQMVFQNPYSSLNPRRRISCSLPTLDVLDITPHRDRQRVDELLDLVGLPSTACPLPAPVQRRAATADRSCPGARRRSIHPRPR